MLVLVRNILAILALHSVSYISLAQQIEAQAKKLQELTVQGKRRPISAQSISHKLGSEAVERSMGQSLASLLERISGVSSIQTGANSSKPVIHGMHGNRILIINNGARQTGQQWGESHTPELDVSNSETIYVVKGAESVRYGSEAMGGVIIMEPKSLSYQSQGISGKIITQYAHNGRGWGQNALIEGTAPSFPQLAWRLQGNYNNNGDRYTGRYILNNTGEREVNLALALGYHKGGLKVESYYSRYASQHGVMLAAQMGDVTQLKERIAVGQPLIFEDWTRHIDYPREQVTHHNLSLKANYTNALIGDLSYQLTLQDDARKEYRIRRNNNSHIPEVDLKLGSLQQQLRWQYTHQSWSVELGGMQQHINNYSISGNGVPPVIPNYVEDSWGSYGIGRYSRPRWALELGLRLDGQRTQAEGYDIVGKPYGGERHFTNFSYNIGGRYTLAHGLYLKSNLGTAWRAPHVHELYSNGQDHGSAAFIRGDDTMQSEQSHKWVTSVHYHSPRVKISLDGYLQWVHNYIYDMPQLRILEDGSHFPELVTVLSGTYPLFRFQQSNAFFRGLDLEASYHINPYVSYELRTALIWANELSTGAYLPYIPPMRIDQSLRFKLPNKLLTTKQAYLEVGHRYVDKQRHFDPFKDLTTDSPPAYQLWNAELKLLWTVAPIYQLGLRLIAENILNEHYKEYTNRARYYSHDLGRNVRLQLSWLF